MRRGEIRWYIFRHPDKRRPVLILTRDEIINRLNGAVMLRPSSAVESMGMFGLPGAAALRHQSVTGSEEVPEKAIAERQLPIADCKIVDF